MGKKNTFSALSDRLKTELLKRNTLVFDPSKIRHSLYRPFCKQKLYFDHLLTQRRYRQQIIFPSSNTANQVICVNQTGEKPFSCLATNVIPNYVMCGGFGAVTQSFPLYTYDEDGSNRKENITDWAQAQFQEHYNDKNISKLHIFHYVYAVLHHHQYRNKYGANLKRELPRIPFTPDFWVFAEAGKQLAELHVNYEKQVEYPLNWLENKDAKLDYRVDRMMLSKDKIQIVYNDFLTLSGIPAEVFEYRLGNRSALDWIIDQYQVSTDKRSGITNDPNNLDDPQYIIHLISKVITVSLETMKIIKALPEL